MSDEVESAIRMPTRNRGCEACGESPLQEVYHWSHIAATRSKRWLFENRIVICKNCGFSFLSPCHEADALSSYYSDSFARFGGQALDFSPEKRLAFIEKAISHRGGLKVEGVIELGGNAATSFQEGLKAAYGEVAAYEPNTECGSDFNDAGQVPSSAFDLLVHYFILEHIPDVRAFLRQCHRMLRAGGVMVLEVPDLMLYPSMIDALILHEHCNHFTPDNLRHLAALEGFRMIEVSHEMCSRPFGFVAAFERLKDSQIETFSADAFERNLAALEDGVQRVLAFRACIQTTLEDLRQHPDLKVVLWGANDNLVKMLPLGETLPNAVLIDSDPRKSDYHPMLKAVMPLDAVGDIQSADRLILFTRLHAPAILNWIEQNTGRRFEAPVILDY